MVSDQLKAIKGNLLIEVFRLDGRRVSSLMFDLDIPANSAGQYLALPLKSLLKHAKPQQVFARIRFLDDSGELASTMHYFVPAKLMPLEKPELDISVDEDTRTVTVTSKTLVRSLFLYSASGDCRFSDNFFDLLPGESRSVMYEGALGEGVKFQYLD